MKKKILIIVIIICFITIGVGIYNYINKKTLQNETWTITQYGADGDSEEQLMCYTIEGNEYGLIIVDGGYEDGEDTINILKQKIEENGNKVDAWILTHFDPDHAGAFKSIYEELKDTIIIDKLYVQDTPDIETCRENASYEEETTWELYQWYLDLEFDSKILVHTGDEIDDIIGLKLIVLSAYDYWIDEQTNNLLNNGSIVFKLYGNEQTMLFTGDVQSSVIEDFLINNYEEELKSDYLQVSHHGNNGFSDEFYNIVNPEVAFFPAPSWIIYNTYNVDWYTAPHIWEYLNELGIKTYCFADSPASVKLR